MKRIGSLLLLAGSLLVSARAGTLVQFDTSVGSMTFELYDAEKPLTTGLFLSWLAQGNYDGTYIHRATNNYLAQTGLYGVVDLGPPLGIQNLQLPLSPDGGVVNEITNANFIANTYGTISMVPWTTAPGQRGYITSAFLFNLGNNTNLDQQSFGGGFPVFGRIVSGFDVFALLNPTNGNPALRVTNFSDALPELPVRTSAGAVLTYDDFIYVNMTVVPEPAGVVLISLGLVVFAFQRRRKMR